MKLFIGNVPEYINLEELEQFFKGYNKQARFEIERLVDKKGIVHVFAIVEIPSERLALKAAKRLHMKKLMDQTVTVREYQYRVISNDRRHLSWRKKLWLGLERRLDDRRDSPSVSAKNSRIRVA